MHYITEYLVYKHLGYLWYLLNKNSQCMVKVEAFLSCLSLTAKAGKWAKTAKQLFTRLWVLGLLVKNIIAILFTLFLFVAEIK